MSIVEDAEGFRYPQIDPDLCTDCGKCRSVCPHVNPPAFHAAGYRAYGGGVKDAAILEGSTSGGIFTALATTWIETTGGVVFGAESHGLDVRHGWTDSVSGLRRFRKSKYAQSLIGDSYAEVKRFLRSGRPVLFSGTPCQVAGLQSFLRRAYANLVTVEVICEGIPTPHYIRRYAEHLQSEAGMQVVELDYRCKDGKKWDFQVMDAQLEDGTHVKTDRWFNPFWNIWLNHLMSRPSCYGCPYAKAERCADVTLGDLWGVHLYCPELYRANAGASLAVCNTPLGSDLLDGSLGMLEGHDLEFSDALKYQAPLRGPISAHPRRAEFMEDVVKMDYAALNEKWAQPPTLKLLAQKYVWGNRQKVAFWNAQQRLRKGDL